jgi:hypothetical protein
LGSLIILPLFTLHPSPLSQIPPCHLPEVGPAGRSDGPSPRQRLCETGQWWCATPPLRPFPSLSATLGLAPAAAPPRTRLSPPPSPDPSPYLRAAIVGSWEAGELGSGGAPLLMMDLLLLLGGTGGTSSSRTWPVAAGRGCRRGRPRAACEAADRTHGGDRARRPRGAPMVEAACGGRGALRGSGGGGGRSLGGTIARRVVARRPLEGPPSTRDLKETGGRMI